MARVTAQYDAERTARARFDEAKRQAHALGDDTSDPMRVILEAADNAAQWMRVCKTMVGGLDEVRYKSAGAGEQLRAEVALFERSMERVAKIHADVVRLGIEDRLVKITERQNAQVVAAIESALDEVAGALGFDPGSPLVRAALGKHLRAVTR
ncbi:MAG: hypothetical protein M3N95_02585 [Actinomycetota bacterium]|nr:hypothetical protein [Actinomycetota bacterium]